jgi:hypothetical protein
MRGGYSNSFNLYLLQVYKSITTLAQTTNPIPWWFQFSGRGKVT